MKIETTLAIATLFCFLFFSSDLNGQTYIVTNTDSEGAGSFRDGMEYANDHSGPDTIHFDLSGDGPFYLETDLPFWDDQTVVDATSQSNFYLGQIVIGTDADHWQNLYCIGTHCEFYGLTAGILTMDSDYFRIGAPGKGNLLQGISVLSADFGIIQSNFIGTNADGTSSLGTEGSGITTSDSNDMLIGGDFPEEGNLVSGKSLDGLDLQDPKNFVIKNNKIGTDITGTYAIPNGRHGINGVVHDAVTIGDSPTTGNLISGNGSHGIVTASLCNQDCLIAGNKVGTDITGTLPIPNGGKGMWISGGTPVTIQENIVAFHEEEGIFIDNVVRKKLIVNNSLFCNETGGYEIDLSDTAGIDSLSMSVIMGTAPLESIVDIYRADVETCQQFPCQGNILLVRPLVMKMGIGYFQMLWKPGYYMVNTTSAEEVTSIISACHLLEDEVIGISSLNDSEYQLTQNIPNPFDQTTQISAYAPRKEKGIVKVFDQAGRLLFKKELQLKSGWNTFTINSDEIPDQGLYFYSFRTANFFEVRKMIKI